MSFCFCFVLLSFAYELRDAELRPLMLVLPGSPLAQQRSEQVEAEAAAAAVAAVLPDITFRDRFLSDASADFMVPTRPQSELANQLVR